MPSDKHGGRGRSAIYNWRVKAGNKEVFSDPVKSKCAEFIRKNDGKYDGKKCRLIPPNL
jgi:hypothetical protein